MIRRSLLLAAAGSLLFIVGGVSPRAESDPMLEIKAQIRAEFPDVSHISSTQLQNWLAGQSSRTPLLLDARTLEEFEVSHLQDARLTPTIETSIAVLADVPRDHPIVAYCAVGYRSSLLARALAERGYTNVFNLEGSIFEWANRGLPVFRNGHEVEEVHPYGWRWEKLLIQR